MNRFGYIAGAIVVIALGYFSFGSKKGANAESHFDTVSLSQGNIKSIVSTAGSMKAVVTVQVGAELSGQIVGLHADFNSEVEKGQIIAQLDDRTIQARLKASNADIESAKANLQQQEANLMKASAELRRAERNYQRLTNLSKSQNVSESEQDNALATFENAKAQIVVAEAQIQVAKVRIQQLQAQQEQINLDLDRTQIRSPVTGTIIDRQIDVGQTVASNFSAPTLFTIAQDLRKMQIEADIDEADIGRVKQGMTTDFSVDAFPNRKFKGVVSQVRKSATEMANVVTYKVIIDADNEDLKLLPGMTANVDVVIEQKESVTRIPNSALRFKPRNQKENQQQGLSKEQKALLTELGVEQSEFGKVEAVMANFRQSMREFMEQSSANPFADRREKMMQLRRTLSNELAAIMDKDKVSSFLEQSMSRIRGNRRGGRGGKPATVWKLENGVMTAVRIRVGVANDEFTEVLSDNLTEKDQLIIRQRMGQR